MKTIDAIYLILPLLITGIIPNAVRAETSAPSKPFALIFVAPGDGGPDAVAILENTRSQVTDLFATVALELRDPFPATTEAQLALGESLLKEQNADLVFWRSALPMDRVVFVYRTDTGTGVMERELTGTGPEGIPDAIGLIARATVEMLVNEDAAAMPAAPAQKQISPNPLEAPPLWRLEGAYVLQLATATPAFTHGVRLSGGVHMSQHFLIAAGAELSSRTESNASLASAERMRFPFHLSVWAIALLNNWRLGGGASAVFSAVNVTPVSNDETVVTDPPYTDFEFSIELLLRAEYRMHPGLSFFLAFGGELFTDTVTYGITDGPVLFEEFLRFQPKLIIGIGGPG